jgi:hypothetical protein
MPDDTTESTFDIEASKPLLHFKACWRVGEETRCASL